MVNAILIWAFLDSFRGRGRLRGWDSFYDYRRDSEEEDQGIMTMWITTMKWVRKVPLMGWLVGAIIILVFLLYHFMRKTWVSQKRLSLVLETGKVKHSHQQRMRDIGGAKSELKDKAMADNRAARNELRKKERKIVAAERKGASDLSNMVNAFFKKDD
jgi:hypothetical protein